MRKELLGIILCSISGAVNATSAFEKYGYIGQFAIPAGISWYQDDYDGLEQFGYSLLATTATVEILKNTVDATRPNGGRKSFPSGTPPGHSVGLATCRCVMAGNMVCLPMLPQGPSVGPESSQTTTIGAM